MLWNFFGSQIGAVFEQGQRAHCNKGFKLLGHDFFNNTLLRYNSKLSQIGLRRNAWTRLFQPFLPLVFCKFGFLFSQLVKSLQITPAFVP